MVVARIRPLVSVQLVEAMRPFERRFSFQHLASNFGQSSDTRGIKLERHQCAYNLDETTSLVREDFELPDSDVHRERRTKLDRR